MVGRTPSTPVGIGISYDVDHREMGGESDDDWAMEDIEVRVLDDASFRGGQYRKAHGVIRGFDRDGCRVVLLDKDKKETGETLTIPARFLEPVMPDKKGPVKIIRGEGRGGTGELVTVQTVDGVVRVNPSQEIHLLKLHSLARYLPP